MSLSKVANNPGNTKMTSNTVARAPTEIALTIEATVASLTNMAIIPGTRMSMSPEVRIVWMEPLYAC